MIHNSDPSSRINCHPVMVQITSHDVPLSSWQTKCAFIIDRYHMQIKHSTNISKLRKLLKKDALTL